MQYLVTVFNKTLSSKLRNEIQIICYFQRYKAEIDFDGRELTRLYLDRLDLARMFLVSAYYSLVFLI